MSLTVWWSTQRTTILEWSHSSKRVSSVFQGFKVRCGNPWGRVKYAIFRMDFLYMEKIPAVHRPVCSQIKRMKYAHMLRHKLRLDTFRYYWSIDYKTDSIKHCTKQTNKQKIMQWKTTCIYLYRIWWSAFYPVILTI